jgi:DNA-binding MarR family transcriptional regulator
VLSFTQWVTLMSLRNKGPRLSATHLSREVGHDMGALTRVIDGLEKSGHVRRERSLEDRRAVQISLTDKGLRDAEAQLGIIVDLQNKLLEPFSKSEADTLVLLLQRLHQTLLETVDAVSGTAVPPKAAKPAAKPSATRGRKQSKRNDR